MKTRDNALNHVRNFHRKLVLQKKYFLKSAGEDKNDLIGTCLDFESRAFFNNNESCCIFRQKGEKTCEEFRKSYYKK